MSDEPTVEEIAAHFSAMDDSVSLINAVVADDTDAIAMEPDGAEGVKLMVTRNTDHLEIQAAKDWYSESSLSKTAYEDAVTAGKAYVAA
jgi:tagatose-1,6-bisphosphate aldolase